MRPLCSFGSGSRTRVRLRRTESCFACGECSTPTVSGLLRKRGVLCPLCFLVGTVGVYTCAPEYTNHFGSKGSEFGTRRGLVPDDGKAEKHARRKSEPASDARGAWFFARATRRDAISKRESCAPSVFWSERSGFTFAPPSARTTSGARVPSPEHAGGLFRTTEKQKNMRAERASRRVMRGALGFSRGQRGEMQLARGSLVPPLFFGRNGRGLHLRPRVHEPLREQGFRVRNTPGACSGRRKSRKTWVPKRRAGEACAERLVFREGNAAEGDEQNEGVLSPLCSWITDVPPGIVFACAARLVFTPRRRRSRSGGAPAPCHAGQR